MSDEVIYKELINDMTWSYSRITCYYNCPYRWFLEYIKGYEEKPQFYSSYGSLIHKLIEQYYNGELPKEQLSVKFLLEFKNVVRGKRPSNNTIEKYIKAGTNYFENFTEFPYKKISVEEQFNFKINDIPFIGFIDFLGEKDGELYIIDNKSKNLKPRSNSKKPTNNDKVLDSMLRQLYLYSAAIKQKYGKFPKELCFNCFKENMFIKSLFDEQKYNETIDWAIKSIEEIQNTTFFKPNINYFNCNYLCGLNDKCCYFQESR